MKNAPKGDGGEKMLFVGLVKYKLKPTKTVVEEIMKMDEEDAKGKITFHGIYWTLGKYDAVVIFEAPNEKEAMRVAIRRGNHLDIETLVAVPLAEASKLIE